MRELLVYQWQLYWKIYTMISVAAELLMATYAFSWVLVFLTSTVCHWLKQTSPSSMKSLRSLDTSFCRTFPHSHYWPSLVWDWSEGQNPAAPLCSAAFINWSDITHMIILLHILISTKAPSNTVCTTTLCTVATNTSTVARWTNCLAHYSNSSNSFTLTTSERTLSHIWQHSSLLGSSHQQWPDEQLLQFTLSREAWQRR